MKIGILSDSHNSLENLKAAAAWLVENEKVDILVHLGDDYEDTFVLEERNVKLIKVPGVYSVHYQDTAVPNRLIEVFDGFRVLISHTEEVNKNDPPHEVKELIIPEALIAKKEVDIVLVGHTHIPRIEDGEGVLIINPGHLKPEDKKGYSPSFGVLDLEERIAKVIDLGTKVDILHKAF